MGKNVMKKIHCHLISEACVNVLTSEQNQPIAEHTAVFIHFDFSHVTTANATLVSANTSLCMELSLQPRELVTIATTQKDKVEERAEEADRKPEKLLLPNWL